MPDLTIPIRREDVDHYRDCAAVLLPCEYDIPEDADGVFTWFANPEIHPSMRTEEGLYARKYSTGQCTLNGYVRFIGPTPVQPGGVVGFRYPHAGVTPYTTYFSDILRLVTSITPVQGRALTEQHAESLGIKRLNFTGWGDEPGIPSFPESDVWAFPSNGIADYSECHLVAVKHWWNATHDTPWNPADWFWFTEFKSGT